MTQSDAIIAIAKWLTSIDRSKRRIPRALLEILYQQHRLLFRRIDQRIRLKLVLMARSVIHRSEDQDRHRVHQTASKVFMWEINYKTESMKLTFLSTERIISSSNSCESWKLCQNPRTIETSSSWIVVSNWKHRKNSQQRVIDHQHSSQQFLIARSL